MCIASEGCPDEGSTSLADCFHLLVHAVFIKCIRRGGLGQVLKYLRFQVPLGPYGIMTRKFGWHSHGALLLAHYVAATDAGSHNSTAF